VKHRCLFLVLFFGLLCISARVWALDLSGVWQADNGVRYLLRQLGSELYWSMDARPRATNIFMGRIEGSTITGRWIDMPGAQLLNSGTLTLRIESPDRLVKVSSSIAYGESVWTRVGASPATPPAPVPVPPAAPPPAPGSPPPSPSTTATWGTQANQWRGQNGRRETLACPPGGPTAGRLWGTDIYTDDSSICLAAVHAGLITAAAGGTVTIEIRPGQPAYTGSTRYGVASSGYGGWSGSFVFVGGSPGPAIRGICDDPKTLVLMDQWLSQAIPPQRKGESLRYEPWGRLVGRSLSATLTVPGPPDTRLSRCEYLWQHAAQLQSTNLGTLRDYVNARIGK
jgi:LCCL domain-containing protein